MRYILDFDHTLLDTGKFVAAVVRDGKEEIMITPDIWQQYAVRDFLYEDVLDWLKSKPKESLYILTAMTPSLGPLSCDFQKEKLHSGHFSELVTEIVFMVGEKGKFAAKIAEQFLPHESIIFVDDRLDQCLSVKAALPHSSCFLMVREGLVPTSLPGNVLGVTSLAEVDDIMNKS